MSKDSKVIEIKTAKDSGAERVALFTLDGVEYTVPVKPPIKVVLKFLNQLKKSDNEMLAMLQLLEDMLGPEGYATLLDCDALTDDLLGQIVDQCVERAMGEANNATKN